MKKPILSLSLLMLGASAVYAQTSRSKNVDLPVPNYAEVLAPSGMDTYQAFVVAGENSVLPYTEAEFVNSLKFQSFEQVSDADADTSLAFAMKGLSPEDITLDWKIRKASETHELSILPKPDAHLKVLLMVNGTATQFHRIPILPVKTQEGKIIPEPISFSFAEEEKYLVFYGENRAMPTPFLVEQYLKQLLGDEFLTKSIVPELYALYDNRADFSVEKLYYIKDKKNDALEEETEAKTLAFEEMVASFTTLDELRAGKDQFKPFADYWKAQLQQQDVSDKAGRKVSWGMYMNLHTIAFLQEDFAAASAYLDKAVEMDEKKGITKMAVRVLKDLQEDYAANFDMATGAQLYAANYEKDPLLETIEAIDLLKQNNLKDVPGYVLQDDGTKLEGKISMTFYAPPGSGSSGMISLNGDDTARKVYVKHLNKKGKTRTSSFKCKEVREIVLDGAVYEPVNPKTNVFDATENAMSGFNFSSVIFMKRVFSSENIGLFKDLTDNSYYFSIPGVKKAEMANAEFFAGCPALSERIAAEEFSASETDQIKIAEIYSANCASGTASK